MPRTLHQSTSPFTAPRHWLRDRRNSDAELVEKLRKSAQFIDQWRWGIIGFHSTLIAVWIFLGIKMFDLLQSSAVMIPPQLQSPSVTFPVGIILGLKVGFWVLLSASNIAQATFGNRQHRLLIKYYDRVLELESEQLQTAERLAFDDNERPDAPKAAAEPHPLRSSYSTNESQQVLVSCQ